MNTRLFLISVRGAFLEWGPGCFLTTVALTDETVDPFAVGVRTMGEWVVLSRHADQSTATSVSVAWLQAILGSTDGALLIWDAERQEITDELCDVDCFADVVIRDFADRTPEPLMTMDTQSWPVAVHASPQQTLRGQELPAHSEPIYRAGATPWTPRPCADPKPHKGRVA